MNKKEYNGWYNYETWACNLWYDDSFEDDAERFLEDAQNNYTEGDTFTAKEQAALDLADYIKEVVEEDERITAITDTACFASDLLTAALSEINYHEIAEHYINDL